MLRGKLIWPRLRSHFRRRRNSVKGLHRRAFPGRLFLFYQMCLALYEQRTALLAVIVFALAPSLLKWHFQVRGYSWYFLSIPVLTHSTVVDSIDPESEVATVSFIWIISGLSIWSLELGIAFNWPSGSFCCAAIYR